MTIPRDLKQTQVRALLGGVEYYRKFLCVLSKRIRPITSRLKKGVKFEFTPAMEVIVRELLAELATPLGSVSPTVTPYPTAPAPSTCIATRASTVLVLLSNRSSRTAQWGPSHTSAGLPSIPRGTGPRST